MKRKISVVTLLIFMILLFFQAFPDNAIAASEIEFTFQEKLDPKLEKIGSFYHYETIEAWHYSGGYWKNVKQGITVNDSLVEDLRHLERYFIPSGGYPISFTLPYEVQQAISQGKKVVIQAESNHPNLHIGDMLKFIDQPAKYSVTVSGNKLSAMIHPVFNYEQSALGGFITFTDYGLGLSKEIPFVKQMYGSNGYSLFYKNGTSRGAWNGLSNYVYSPGSNLIDIKTINPDGTFKSTYSINTDPYGMTSTSDIRIGQSSGVFKSAGALGLLFGYPINFNFYVEGEGKSDIVMTEFELVEKATGKVVDRFKRTIDPLDPFNSSKQTLTRTTSTVTKAPVVKAGVEYKIRAKYQFISFAEGAFDIKNPASMTAAQKAITTGVNRNQLNIMYSYDSKALVDGSFDYTGVQNSNDKPSIALKNMETATFEWDYQVPATVKRYVKLAGKIPVDFAAVNTDTNNDWAVVYGQIATSNIGITEPVKLYRGGTEVKFLDPNSSHSVRFRVAHLFGEEDIVQRL